MGFFSSGKSGILSWEAWDWLLKSQGLAPGKPGILFLNFHNIDSPLWPCQDLGTGSRTAGSGSEGKEAGRAIAMETMWLAYW